MLKRVFCVIFSVLLAASACICAAAADAQSQAAAAAPDGLTFVFSYPNEGSECIEAVFSVPYDLCTAANDFERFAACIQFDWSIDSRDAFHHDETRSDADTNCPVQQLDGSFVQKKEVFWFAYPEAAERCAGALKETSADGAAVRTFDFDAHRLYVRARFMVYEYASGTYTFSGWSDVYDVGADKGADTPKIPDTGEDRPALNDAWLEDGVLCFAVQYPDSIKETAYALLRGYGVMLNFESQLRADGGKWEYRLTENGDLPYLSGTRSVDISDLTSAQTIEYRFRLIGHDPSNGSALITGWSDYLTVKDGAVKIVENDDPFGRNAEAKRQADAEKEANKCKLCGFCPFHPFGVCMFIWLAIILLIVLVIVYNVFAVRKKRKHEAEVRAREEAARRSAPDKTGSFIQTDRITLQKKDDPQAEEPAAAQTQEDETDES